MRLETVIPINQADLNGSFLQSTLSLSRTRYIHTHNRWRLSEQKPVNYHKTFMQKTKQPAQVQIHILTWLKILTTKVGKVIGRFLFVLSTFAPSTWQQPSASRSRPTGRGREVFRNPKRRPCLFRFLEHSEHSTPDQHELFIFLSFESAGKFIYPPVLYGFSWWDRISVGHMIPDVLCFTRWLFPFRLLLLTFRLRRRRCLVCRGKKRVDGLHKKTYRREWWLVTRWQTSLSRTVERPVCLRFDMGKSVTGSPFPFSVRASSCIRTWGLCDASSSETCFIFSPLHPSSPLSYSVDHSLTGFFNAPKPDSHVDNTPATPFVAEFFLGWHPFR